MLAGRRRWYVKSVTVTNHHLLWLATPPAGPGQIQETANEVSLARAEPSPSFRASQQ